MSGGVNRHRLLAARRRQSQRDVRRAELAVDDVRLRLRQVRPSGDDRLAGRGETHFAAVVLQPRHDARVCLADRGDRQAGFRQVLRAGLKAEQVLLVGP